MYDRNKQWTVRCQSILSFPLQIGSVELSSVSKSTVSVGKPDPVAVSSKGSRVGESMNGLSNNDSVVNGRRVTVSTRITGMNSYGCNDGGGVHSCGGDRSNSVSGIAKTVSGQKASGRGSDNEAEQSDDRLQESIYPYILVETQARLIRAWI